MTLALATDSASPYDYSQRPAGCAVILGYVGRPGYTPHVWSHGEAAAARATGCQWWPIGVGISQGATSAQDGHDLAAYMISVLPGYGVSKTTPVFQDLEPNALRADTAAASQCVAAWKTDMRAAGYTRPYTYSVDAPFIDWMARWDNIRPATLPAGKIGVQYGGAVSPPGYDLSVFDPTLLGDDMPQLDATDLQAISDKLRPQWRADYIEQAGKMGFATAVSLQGTTNEVLHVKSAVAALPVPPTVDQIAAAVAVDQAALERAVVDAVAVALAGGVPVETIEQGVTNAIGKSSIPLTLTGHAGVDPVAPA